MANTKLMELRPNRSLLNSNFDGYKLSLKEIPIITDQLTVQVDRLVPDSSQYSLLHAKLFVLQNHLIGQVNNECVYFLDKSWNVQKYTVDQLSQTFMKQTMWQIPLLRERKLGDYNASIKCITDELVAVSDGMGTLYILDIGDNEESWTIKYSGEVIGPDENFIISDSVYKDTNKKEVHLLLTNIRQNDVAEKNCSILHWVTLTRDESNWNQTSIRELTVKGHIQYSYFERTCNAVYVVSDSSCVFTLDSEKEIKPNEAIKLEKNHTWSQTASDVTLKFPLAENSLKTDIKVNTSISNIEVKYKDEILLEGNLYQRIDSDTTCWSLEHNILEIVLQKFENGLMWPEVVTGNQFGEYIADPALANEIAQNLVSFTSDKEEVPQSGTTFNSQQVEECDFETDKFTVFERLSCDSHLVTHKANLGSHQVLLTVDLQANLPPGLGIRSDVDTCIWQPNINSEEFSLEHKGTLLALGYIQASKQQMKYFVCSPDLSYSVICEYSKHLFIYCQKKSILANELRNRVTGQRITSLAQQQVYNLPSSDEILGAFASNNYLYILGETFITALKIM